MSYQGPIGIQEGSRGKSKERAFMLGGLVVGMVIGGYAGYKVGFDTAALSIPELKEISHEMAQIGWEKGVEGKGSNWVHVYIDQMIDMANQ